MKIINDDGAYITSILLLVMLIPVLLLMIFIVDEYTHDVNSTVERLESDKIKSLAEDLEEETLRVTKESLHNISYEAVKSKTPATKEKIKKYIQNRINENIHKLNGNYVIQCVINDVKPSNNPFEIELTYHYVIITKDNRVKLTKNMDKTVEITDKKYPVYDPLPTLKTGATLKEYYVEYEKKLSDFILFDESDVYVNVTEPIVIRQCPINDYSQHGNSNRTMMFCLNNHFYHNSHDGMCFLCRLENRTGCNHYGLETFILPTGLAEHAPASIDHVLLNDRNNQYPGNPITINGSAVIYLDNGHKTKYGL